MGLMQPTNVVEESWLLFWLTKALGLHPVEVRRRGFPGYLYAALLIILYYILFFAIKDFASTFLSELQEVALAVRFSMLQCYFNLLYLPLMIWSTLLSNWKVKRTYQKLQEIDETFAYLNAHFRYPLHMRIEAVTLSSFIFITILINLGEYYGLVNAGRTYTFDLMWTYNFVPELVNTVMLCAFILPVLKLRLRFSKVNRVIATLVNGKDSSTIFVSPSVNNASRLRLVRRIHRELQNLACTLNDAYGFQLLVSLVVFLLHIVKASQGIYMKFGNVKELVDLILDVMFVFFNFGKYFCLAHICHSTSIQVKFAGELLHETPTGPAHSALKHEVEAFSRQLIDKRLQFTACNFFDVDYTMIRTVVATLVAYLVIINHV